MMKILFLIRLPMLWLKFCVKKMLHQIGLYESVRWSRLYLCYIALRPAVSKRQRNEQIFLSPFISPNSLYFDVGANVGAVTETFLKLKAKKVISIECDPKNIRILKCRYHGNRKVEIVGKAVSDVNLTQSFYQVEEGSAYNTLSTKWKTILEDKQLNRLREAFQFTNECKVETVTLDSLIQQYGIPDCIKVDVEGYELNVFKGLHYQIPLIWFEANLPEFRGETIECIRQLQHVNPQAVFNYTVRDLDDEGAQFFFGDWVYHQAAIEAISETQARYMQVFCKNA